MDSNFPVQNSDDFLLSLRKTAPFQILFCFFSGWGFFFPLFYFGEVFLVVVCLGLFVDLVFLIKPLLP